ncbi:MAG: AMP-binding protein [Tumebacillaceae bacterium]
MIIVDKQRYTRDDLNRRCELLAQTEGLQQPEGRVFAIAVRDAFAVLAIVLYLRDHGGSVLLMHGETPHDAAEAKAQLAGCTALITDDGLDVQLLGEGIRVEEASLFQFSSGTTGDPKLIARSWEEVAQEIDGYNAVIPASNDEVPIILVPVSHSYGLIAGTMTALARGVEPIIVQDKNPKFALQIIKSNPRHIVYGVPFLYHILSSLGKDVRFHKLLSSGSPMTETLLQTLRDRSEAVLQQYGCTEAGCLAIGERITAASHAGRPLAHVEITAGTKEDPQEVVAVFKHLPKRVHTQDLGYFTEEGQLHVLGRLDDLINVSGLKVIPSEVESVLTKYPGVREVVVYKGKHPVWGETVKALIVPDAEVSPPDVKAWCIRHLSPHQVPSAIGIVEEIPKTPTGKVSRKLLHELELTQS